MTDCTCTAPGWPRTGSRRAAADSRRCTHCGGFLSGGNVHLTGTASADLISAISSDTTTTIDAGDLIYGNPPRPAGARNRHERRRRDALRRRSHA